MHAHIELEQRKVTSFLDIFIRYAMQYKIPLNILYLSYRIFIFLLEDKRFKLSSIHNHSLQSKLHIIYFGSRTQRLLLVDFLANKLVTWIFSNMLEIMLALK